MALLSRGLETLGFQFAPPEAAMYVFARHPRIRDSAEFTRRLLDHGVAAAPGNAVGPYREFIRISASADEEDLKRAMRRIARALA